MVKKEDGPDQARSWAICMAGYVINTLLSGISRTTGQFYVSLIETYGISRMEANMPFTLRNVVRNLTGNSNSFSIPSFFFNINMLFLEACTNQIIQRALIMKYFS